MHRRNTFNSQSEFVYGLSGLLAFWIILTSTGYCNDVYASELRRASNIPKGKYSETNGSKKTHKKRTENRQAISVEIHMGDKDSLVRLNPDLSYFVRINDKITSKGILSETNYEYLKELALDVLIEPQTDLKKCQRSNILLIMHATKKSTLRSACIGSKTSVARKLGELVDTVALL